MTDVGLRVDHDRPVGHIGKGRETFVGNVRRPRAVESDARVYDGRIIRQRSHALSDLSHWQTDQVDEFKFVSEAGDFLPVMAAYGLTLPSVTHHSDTLEVWHQHSRSCHGVAELLLIKRSGYVGRKAQSSTGLLVDPGKNHRHPRPKLVAGAQHKVQR